MNPTLTVRCSGLPLAAACPASTVPPAVTVAGARAAADLGSAAHAVLARWLALGRDWADVERLAPEHGVSPAELGPLCAWGWRAWEALRGHFPSPRAEVPLAASFDSGVALTGHVDVLSCPAQGEGDGADEVRVLDYKSGRLDGDHDDQVKGYAYLALLAHPAAALARTAVVRLRDMTADWVVHTRLELEAWWARLQHRLLNDRDTYTPGRHCQHCPRSHECPAKTALLRQAHEALLDASERPGALLSLDPAHRGPLLGDLWHEAALLERLATTVKDLVRAEVAAAGGVLPAGHGWELRLREQRTLRLEFAPAWEARASLGLPEQALAESATLGRGKLEAAAKALAPRGLKKTAAQELLGRLEAAGAVRTERSLRLELRRSGEAGAIAEALREVEG